MRGRRGSLDRIKPRGTPQLEGEDIDFKNERLNLVRTVWHNEIKVRVFFRWTWRLLAQSELRKRSVSPGPRDAVA